MEVPKIETSNSIKKKTGVQNNRIKKLATKCEHTDRVHYSKGMCRNCYHSKGRTKMADQCEHTDRKLYARGLCKACYLRLNYKQAGTGADK